MNAPDSRHRRRRPPAPRGFTMVELLMVIVVIALLAALLLPAITGAVKNARNAQVTAEINQMAQALADFKSKYGDYPPSRLILNENGDFTTTTLVGPFSSPNSTDQSTQALIQRSVSFLRKFWPRFQVTTTVTGGLYTNPTTTGWPDYNGNGVQDQNPVILSGDECLVWFLGGLPQGTSGVTVGSGVPPTSFQQNWGMTGFSRNPSNPFMSSLTSPANRVVPFFEFKTTRLVDLDGDGYPSYLDPLGTNRPYAYFSSYAGTGYDPNDVNFDPQTTMPTQGLAWQLKEQDDSGTVPVTTLQFRVAFPTTQQVNNFNAETSPSPNPYTTTPTFPTAQPPTFLNPQTFQILSAGGDALYGLGGQYTPNAPTVLPFDANFSSPTTDTAIRAREDDNLSNFSTGRLN